MSLPGARKYQLTDKQYRFCEEYIIDFNGARAIRDAGYGTKNSSVAAANLLKNKKIVEVIRHLQREIGRKTNVHASDVLQEFSRLAFANIGNYISWTKEGKVVCKASDELTDDMLAAVSEIQQVTSVDGSVKFKFKLHDKKAALDSVARCLGMFVERREIGGPNGGPIKTSINYNRLSHTELKQLYIILKGMEEEDDGNDILPNDLG